MELKNRFLKPLTKNKIGTFESISQAVMKWSTGMRLNNLPINAPITLEKTWEFLMSLIVKIFKNWGNGQKDGKSGR